MIAYAFRSGQIYMGTRAQEGTVELASGHPTDLDAALCKTALISEDRSCFLVPGLAEASNDDAAIAALVAFGKEFCSKLELVSRHRDRKPEVPGHTRWSHESMVLARRGLA